MSLFALTCSPGVRRRKHLPLLLFLAGCLSGCALGKAEYRVVQASPTPPPTATATPVVTTAVTPEPAPGPFTYTVQPDESLWRICRRLLGDPLAFRRAAAANHLGDSNLIQPGQRLTLDPAWSRARSAPAPASTPVPILNQNGSGQTLNPSGSGPSPQAGAGTPPPTSTPSATPTPAYPVRVNRAFRPGEKLMFSVEYFGIAAGFATLAVEEGPAVQGRPTLRLVAEARTHPAFEWFFKVRDRIESWFDAQGLFSWHYEKHLREGGYSNDSSMVYDQLKQRVVKDEGRTTVPAAPWTQDVLSEFYFFRTLDFKPGSVLTVPVFADDGKAYELVVTVLRRERIGGPTGTFDCIVVQPALKFEGLFQQKGAITIWLTDDEHRVPVLIKSQIVIGTIDIVLRDATVVE